MTTTHQAMNRQREHGFEAGGGGYYERPCRHCGFVKGHPIHDTRSRRDYDAASQTRPEEIR